jgi:hypothetical protein
LLWILVPVFAFIVGPTNFASSNGDWGRAVGNTVAQLVPGLFIAAGIITLVFAVLEQTQAIAGVECKWDPLKLPPLRTHDQQPSTVKTICELSFGLVGFIWLLLLPHYPVLILGPGAAILKAGPIWHRFYVPIVIAWHPRNSASRRHSGKAAGEVVPIIGRIGASSSQSGFAEFHS